jgi:tRNA dimethylallyltransferase
MKNENWKLETPPLVVIVGPTASGKTGLSIELAKKFDGEIVCADSRTVYRYLDIGTAKPTSKERAEVPHHLLDVVDPDQPFTVADFKKLANKAIVDIQRRGKLPILVGGSGLYVDAVIFDYQFSSDNAPRDAQNPRHVDKDAVGGRSQLRQNTLIFGLDIARETLRQRITNRVDAMAEQGFIEEVQYILQHFPGSKALDAPGYKAFCGYLDGEFLFDDAKAQFVRNDFQLAKRQMTWFRRNNSIQWFDSAQDALIAATSLLMDSKKRGKNSSIITTP